MEAKLATMNHLTFEKNKEIKYRNVFSDTRFLLFKITEKIYKSIINNTDHRINIIVNLIEKNNPKNILEIGSGTLSIFDRLPKNIQENCQYYICEINPKKVSYLKKKYPKIVVKCADALDLPFENNYFDFVFSKGVLHHIDHESNKEREAQRIKFLMESMRVLKNGGKNLLMDFDYLASGLEGKIWHKIHKIILQEGEHNFLNFNNAKQLFADAGYNNVFGKKFNTFKGMYYFIISNK